MIAEYDLHKHSNSQNKASQLGSNNAFNYLICYQFTFALSTFVVFHGHYNFKQRKQALDHVLSLVLNVLMSSQKYFILP